LKESDVRKIAFAGVRYWSWMDLLLCGHAAHRDERRACQHLLTENPPFCVRMLTGDGMRYDLACLDCAGQPDRLMVVCEGCVARAEQHSCGEWVSAYRAEPADRRARIVGR